MWLLPCTVPLLSLSVCLRACQFLSAGHFTLHQSLHQNVPCLFPTLSITNYCPLSSKPRGWVFLVKTVSDIIPELNLAVPNGLCLLCPSFLSLSKEERVDGEVQGCFWLAQKNFLSRVFHLLEHRRWNEESPLVPLAPSPRMVPLDSPSLYTLMPAAMHLLQPGTLQIHGTLAWPSLYFCTPHGTALPPTLEHFWHNYATPLTPLHLLVGVSELVLQWSVPIKLHLSSP